MKLDVRLPLLPPDDHECRKSVLILILVVLSTTYKHGQHLQCGGPPPAGGIVARVT